MLYLTVVSCIIRRYANSSFMYSSTILKLVPYCINNTIIDKILKVISHHYYLQYIFYQYQRVNCGVKSLRNTVTHQQKFRYTLIFYTRCEFTTINIIFLAKYFFMEFSFFFNIIYINLYIYTYIFIYVLLKLLNVHIFKYLYIYAYVCV